MDSNKYPFLSAIHQIGRPYYLTAGLLLFLIAVVYISLLFLPHDNEIEQAAEQIIEHQTGLKIDFSPES